MAKQMKNDLPYFSHDNDAHNHPKMRALRSRFGWTGYGQFWALNEAVAAAPECRLDLTRKVVRASVACELGLTPDGFEDFLIFLSDPDECGLVHYEDGIVTTERTQEDYQRVAPEREKARARYVKKATSGEKSIFSGEKHETSGEEIYRGEEKREEKRGEEKRKEEERNKNKSKSAQPADEPDSIFPDDPDPLKPKSGKAATTTTTTIPRFAKPKLEEIIAYCAERKNTVSPDKFLDYYEANGWRVGRNPMKDWRAAVRTWEKNEAAFGPKDPRDFEKQEAERRKRTIEKVMQEINKNGR